MTKRDCILLMLTLRTIENDLAKSNGALELNAHSSIECIIAAHLDVAAEHQDNMSLIGRNLLRVVVASSSLWPFLAVVSAQRLR
jgi:hypothetical protein